MVAGFQDGKLSHEHIYWDQASLLVQAGLLDPAGLPVAGAEQADKLLAPRAVPANALLGPDWPGPNGVNLSGNGIRRETTLSGA